MPVLRRVVPVLLLLVLACQNARPLPAPSALPTGGPQVLRVAVAALPQTLDPALAPGYDSAASRALFETLVKPAPDLAGVVPAAAVRWDVSADGLTYDFSLRPHSRWSDGRPVLASDFVFAWKRLLDPRVNAPAAEVLAPLVRGAGAWGDLDPKADAAKIPAFIDGLGVSAPDDATFRVVLAHPDLAFLSAATMPATAPERAGGTTMGNGPFRLRESTPSQLTFEPNPYYAGRRSRLSALVLFKRGDSVADVDRFAKGREEITTLVAENADALAGNPALADRLGRTPALQAWWLQFNVHKPPFDRPQVRLAFAKALDRDALVRDLFKGMATAATSLYPNGMAGYRPGLQAQRFDPVAARATLGAPASDLEGIHLLVRDLQPDRRVAEWAAAQVKANLGLDLTLDVLPSTAVTKKLATGDFQMAGPAGWIADYADPQNFADLFVTHGHGQFSRYSSSTYDHLVAEADADLDPTGRLQTYLQAQQLLVQDAPVAFLYNPQTWYLRQPTVLDLTPTPMDDWPGNLYAEQIHLGR